MPCNSHVLYFGQNIDSGYMFTCFCPPPFPVGGGGGGGGGGYSGYK